MTPKSNPNSTLTLLLNSVQ